VGGVCGEIDAGWETRIRLYVLSVGGVCDKIDAGWDAENNVAWISSSGEKWERRGKKYVRRSTPVGSQRIRLYVL